MFLLFVGDASAWEVRGTLDPEALPFVWTVEDDPFLVDAATAAAALWEHECMGPLFVVEIGPGDPWATDDGVNFIGWDDGKLDGFPLMTRESGESPSYPFDGYDRTGRSEADIVIDPDYAWASEAEIAAGECASKAGLAAGLGHEMGHVLGLGHSCDQAEPCVGIGLDALMYWSSGPCTAAWLGEDDRLGLLALYGSTPGVTCRDDIGYAPLSVSCGVDGRHPEQVLDGSWDFGDGTIADGLEVEHVYEAAGEHTISACFDVDAEEACHESCRVGPTITTCAPVKPGFEMEPVGELGRSFTPNAEIDWRGCVEGIEWKVRDGEEVIFTSYEPAPIVVFPRPGTYFVTVAMTDFDRDVFEATHEIEVAEDEPADDLTEPSTCGCASASAGSGWPLLLVVLLARKRRSS